IPTPNSALACSKCGFILYHTPPAAVNQIPASPKNHQKKELIDKKIKYHFTRSNNLRSLGSTL
ncbi:hypothetical protein J6W32_04245, partial [bacterium]|nr:hypothetical protein [bacterium]